MATGRGRSAVVTHCTNSGDGSWLKRRKRRDAGRSPGNRTQRSELRAQGNAWARQGQFWPGPRPAIARRWQSDATDPLARINLAFVLNDRASGGGTIACSAATVLDADSGSLSFWPRAG